MALKVHAWPARLPDSGLLVIGTVNPAGADRAAARVRIRAALRQAVAQSLGLGLAQVALESIPGTPPRLLIDGSQSAAGVSISHAGALSVAAFNPAGAVGIDLMDVAQAQQMPDWRQVARDYLGIAVAERLEGAHAFAQAWAEREAQLKLLGLPLAEWTQLPDCRLEPLALPAGLVGALARF